jgi:hypothetical protein
MFGWGVDSTDAYLSQFAKLMEDSAPQVSWQITNTAVPGYNLAMEVQTFETKGRQLEPDVVIVGWVNNDLDLPHFLRPLPSILRIDRLYFLERLLGRLEGRSGGKFSSPAIRVAGSRIEVVSPRYLEDLPSDLRELVGREAFDRSIRDLAAAAQEQGFEVIMLVYRGRVARFLQDACDQHGIPIVATRDLEKQFRRGNRHRSRQGPGLTIGDGDPHPSAAGHRLIATALRNHFVESGLAEALVGRAEGRALVAQE